jgi:hypothetical protein
VVLTQLRERLLSDWPERNLGCGKPKDLGLLVQGTGVGKICCYLFPGDATEPRWVAKIPRNPQDNERLVREYSLIQNLRDRGSFFVRATVPGPLWMSSIGGHVLVLEPYLHGQRMDDLLMRTVSSSSSNASTCMYVQMALEWILHAQLEEGAQPRRLSTGQVQRYLIEPMSTLRSTARLMPAESAFLDRIEANLGCLAQRPLPLVFYHGDFQPANLLVTSSGLKVIDWEFGEPLGLPLMDVFSLLARTYAAANGLDEIDGYLEDYFDAFDAVFSDRVGFGALSAACVARACQALGVDAAWVAVLFALFLVNEANKYYAFLTHRAQRGYVYLLQSRNGQIQGSFANQLARQKYVWLLGHLARHDDCLVFGGAS